MCDCVHAHEKLMCILMSGQLSDIFVIILCVCVGVEDSGFLASHPFLPHLLFSWAPPPLSPYFVHLGY